MLHWILLGMWRLMCSTRFLDPFMFNVTSGSRIGVFGPKLFQKHSNSLGLDLIWSERFWSLENQKLLVSAFSHFVGYSKLFCRKNLTPCDLSLLILKKTAPGRVTNRQSRRALVANYFKETNRRSWRFLITFFVFFLPGPKFCLWPQKV